MYKKLYKTPIGFQILVMFGIWMIQKWCQCQNCPKRQYNVVLNHLNLDWHTLEILVTNWALLQSHKRSHFTNIVLKKTMSQVSGFLSWVFSTNLDWPTLRTWMNYLGSWSDPYNKPFVCCWKTMSSAADLLSTSKASRLIAEIKHFLGISSFICWELTL